MENMMGQQEHAQAEHERPLLKAVHCNYIPVADSQKAAEWYGKHLGLKRLRPGSNILILGNGQWFFLCDSKDRKNANFYADFDGKAGYEMFSLTFETENIVQLHEALRQSGTYVEPIQDHGECGLQFRFKDLDGNKFNVWQNPKRTQ